MYTVEKASIGLGATWSSNHYHNEIVIAADYHFRDPINPEFVILTANIHPGYKLYTYAVLIVKEVSPLPPSQRRDLFSPSVKSDWLVCYEENSFRDISSAIHGKMEVPSKYDKMYDQAQPWIPGYNDCLHREP